MQGKYEEKVSQNRFGVSYFLTPKLISEYVIQITYSDRQHEEIYFHVKIGFLTAGHVTYKPIVSNLKWNSKDNIAMKKLTAQLFFP